MDSILFSAVEGNRQCLDGGAMFGHVPKALWSRWERPDIEGRIPLACRCLLVETKNTKILFETGIGAFFEPALAQRYGVQNPTSHQLLKNLNAMGIQEEDIDYVILSHLHFDHAGGLLPAYKPPANTPPGPTPDPTPGFIPGSNKNKPKDLCFPNAKYVVGERAFLRACQPHLRDKASFIPGLTNRLQKSERLVLLKPGDTLTGCVIEQELSFIWTEGHTPGHIHALLTGPGGEKLFFAGDLIPGKAWVHLPITMGYDRYPEKLIEEKQKLYARAEKEKWWIFWTHDKSFALANIRKNNKGQYESYNEQGSKTHFMKWPK